jgi:hypothetical protein
MISNYQYLTDTARTAREAIRTQMHMIYDSIRLTLDTLDTADKLTLDSLYQSLDSISCNVPIVSKWKDIYKIYVNFMKNDSVSVADRALVDSYKTHCADLYGDGIYLARMMARSYEDVDYDVYDGCIQTPTPRDKSDIARRPDNVKAYPNPSTGIIHLSFATPFTGDIMIYNNLSQLISKASLHDQSQHPVDITNSNGIHLIRCTAVDGRSEILKVFINK